MRTSAQGICGTTVWRAIIEPARSLVPIPCDEATTTQTGIGTERIMDHTGHQSAAMVRVYTRRADAFADHAGEGLL
jgi:hypothetical protein